MSTMPPGDPDDRPDDVRRPGVGDNMPDMARLPDPGERRVRLPARSLIVAMLVCWFADTRSDRRGSASSSGRDRGHPPASRRDPRVRRSRDSVAASRRRPRASRVADPRSGSRAAPLELRRGVGPRRVVPSEAGAAEPADSGRRVALQPVEREVVELVAPMYERTSSTVRRAAISSSSSAKSIP